MSSVKSSAIFWYPLLAHQFAAQGVGAEQGLRQGEHGSVAGAQDGGAPVAAGAEGACGQAGQKARSDQAGLAAAGRPDNGEKALPLQDFQQPFGVPLAPEKDFALVRLERA